MKDRTLANLTLITACVLCLSARHPGVCQSPSAEPAPAYEVATIKPISGEGPGVPLLSYITSAYGFHLNTTGYVIGPAWLKETRYAINAKPPESIRLQMQSMSPVERSNLTHAMMQGLLADRFHMKAHFETRQMPVYQLVVSKGGPKLQEAASPPAQRLSVGGSSIRASGIGLNNLVGALESTADVGRRKVIDNTGLSGYYDFQLKWAPMQVPASSAGESPSAPAPGIEGASLFTAIEEQLGLKLVPASAAEQVLVIDHIERPSEN